MIKIINSLEDPHVITYTDAKMYNSYQKTEGGALINGYLSEFWKQPAACTVHSALRPEDFENYGKMASFSPAEKLQLEDFDTKFKHRGKTICARFSKSKINRPSARILCGLNRPDYWFDCFVYNLDDKKSTAPIAAILFSYRQQELYANLLYYKGDGFDNCIKKGKKVDIRYTNESSNDDKKLCEELVFLIYNAWVLTQWLRISRPVIERQSGETKKPQKSPQVQPKPKTERSASRTEYNDRFVSMRAEKIAIVDGELKRGYHRYTKSWIRTAHERTLTNGKKTSVKAALCGEKTSEAINAFVAYLAEHTESKPKAPEQENVEVTYRCHKRKK